MTPMIDVVFLLIIFFLCIEFRVLEAKVPVYMPRKHGTDKAFVEPEEELRISIECIESGTRIPRPGKGYYLVGREVNYVLGPASVPSLESLRDRLRAIHDDPQRDVVDTERPGRAKKMDVLVVPGPGVVYGDVAQCVDVIMATGFETVKFAGGSGRQK